MNYTSMNRLVILFPLFLCMAIVLGGCSSVKFFTVNLPTHFSDVEITRDVAFGDDDLQVLDIYVPAKGAGPHEVVVFFYGGRWSFGEKEQYSFVGTSLASQGYVVVIPDYRKYPQVKFPAFVEDGASAVAWVHGNIENYNGDPARLHLAGHSSGAHIGALLATDERYLAAHELGRGDVTSFAGLSGPYDFVPEEEDLKDMFGPPEQYPQMQVGTFIDGQQPPFFMQYGGADETVHRRNMDLVEAAINEQGGCVRTKIYADINHVWMVGSFSWLGRHKAPIRDDMVAFFRAASAGNPCAGQEKAAADDATAE